MTIAEILWEAKSLICRQRYSYCCNAILSASKPEGTFSSPIDLNYPAADELFKEMFHHHDTSLWYGLPRTENRQKSRAEALELAALSAEREALYLENQNGKST